MWLVYTPLLTYRHAEGERGSELIPGLAERLPEISADGMTYRLRLREGLKYSDGTAVKASDFEHTVKRLLALGSAATGFLRRRARRRRVPQAPRAGRGHRRNQDRRRLALDRDRAQRPGRHLLERPGHALRRRGAGRHAVPQPHEDPSARRGAVPYRSLVGRQRLRDGACGGLRAAGRPGREARQDHDEGRGAAPCDPGRAARQARLHAGPAPAGPAARGAISWRSLPRGAHRGHELLLPQLERAALRQAGRPPGGEPGHQRGRPGSCIRRTDGAHVQLPAARHARLREARSVPLRLTRQEHRHRPGQALGPAGGRQRGAGEGLGPRSRIPGPRR